jgi:hypothetical protein
MRRESGRRRGAGEGQSEGGCQTERRFHAITCFAARLRAAKLALSARGFKQGQ